MDRRELLKLLGTAGIGAAAGLVSASPKPERGRQVRPKPAVKMGFLTDFHLPSKGKDEEFRRVFEKLRTAVPDLDIILFGGDNIFAADGASASQTVDQLEHWTRMVNSVVKIPTYSVIGNHDIWGINHSDPKLSNIGKSMAVKAFNMPNRYYSFGVGNWRFIALDTVHRGRANYTGLIDPEQLDWLGRELEKNRQPTVLFGHVPIVSVSPFLHSQTNRKGGCTRFAHNRVLGNGYEVSELLRKHKHAKLSLGGHIHMVDHVRVHHTTYVCGGAVSGAWWKGEYEHFKPVINIVELYDSGRVSNGQIEWQA